MWGRLLWAKILESKIGGVSMDRNQAKELLPIFTAYSEGKEIECRVEDKWYKVLEICNETNPQDYRIKLEPKYRPFKDAKECWQEMQKHQPFGWVKSIDNKDSEVFIHCTAITKVDGILTGIDEIPFPYYGMFNNYTFADGTPFGIKEEE